MARLWRRGICQHCILPCKHHSMFQSLQALDDEKIDKFSHMDGKLDAHVDDEDEESDLEDGGPDLEQGPALAKHGRPEELELSKEQVSAAAIKSLLCLCPQHGISC